MLASSYLGARTRAAVIPISATINPNGVFTIALLGIMLAGARQEMWYLTRVRSSNVSLMSFRCTCVCVCIQASYITRRRRRTPAAINSKRVGHMPKWTYKQDKVTIVNITIN